MNRREFFSLAAASAVAMPKSAQAEGMESIISRVEAAIRRELPDVKSVEINYDPADERVPLVVVAFRI